MSSIVHRAGNRLTARAFGALLGLLAISCANAGGPPTWVERPDADYPEMSYLTAVGSGENLASASAQATAGIMQIFVSKVDQTLSDHQQSRVEAGRRIEESNLELKTVIESSGAVEGVLIKNTWHDRKAGRHYALAVLDKDAARDALDNRLTVAESELAQSRATANASRSPLERAQRLSGVIEAADARDILAAQYRVLGDGAWRARPATATIRAERNHARDAVVFVVDARLLDSASGTEKPLPSIARALAEMLSDRGFKVDRGAEASMRIDCSVTLSEPFERGPAGFTHYTWEGSVELANRGAGEPELLVYKSEGSASNRTPDLARRRTLIDAEETIVSGFRQRMDGYLEQAE